MYGVHSLNASLSVGPKLLLAWRMMLFFRIATTIAALTRGEDDLSLLSGAKLISLASLYDGPTYGRELIGSM